MRMWLAVVLVGLGSYLFRLAPLLLGERVRLSERAEATLRRAAVAAMTSLLVLGVSRMTADRPSPDAIAVVLALATAGTLALRGRSMTMVVLCGGVTYGVALGVVRVLGA